MMEMINTHAVVRAQVVTILGIVTIHIIKSNKNCEKKDSAAIANT